mgnify:CR=1 FL=1
MSNVRRVYVEKKPAFAVKAKELKHEIKHYLGISTVTAVRELIRYDVENISDEVFEKACKTVFAEPPVDDLYLEKFDVAEGARVFSVEFLPGQFDQRADSAVQCVQFLDENAAPIIRSATTYVIEGNVTDAEFEAIKHHCINPVDSRETGLEKPETLVTVFPDPEDVKIFDGFKDMAEADLKELYSSLNLAMTFKDFQHIQNYFRNEEKRDPSMTEIRVLDTYWSDHCRHTTFSTELTQVKFDEGDYKTPIVDTYNRYLSDREVLYKGRDDKFVCLMDLALMAMRKLKKEGKNHIVTSAIEHHAILHAAQSLEEDGFDVTYLAVDEKGRVSADDVRAAIRPETALVSVMYANNEIGTIQPISEIGAVCREAGVLFHTDAVQAAGTLPIDVQAQNIDMLSVSAHKFHGPKGIGLLYCRRGLYPDNLLDGGAQERGHRAGTENVAYIVGMAAALEEACGMMDEKGRRLAQMRDRIQEGLLKIPGTRVNGDEEHRLPGTDKG